MISSLVDPDELTKVDTSREIMNTAIVRNPGELGALIYLPRKQEEKREEALAGLLLADMATHFRHNLFRILRMLNQNKEEYFMGLKPFEAELFLEIDTFIGERQTVARETGKRSIMQKMAEEFRRDFLHVFTVFCTAKEPLEDEKVFEELAAKIEVLDPQEVFVPGSVDLVGKGGFGMVYKARLKHTGQEVALKLIREKDKKSSARAKDEGICLMENDHIEGVLSAQVLFRTRSDIAGIKNSAGHLVLITELVKGPTLRSRFNKTQQPDFLEQQRRLMILAEVCHIMAQVHLQGIVHRDLKPSNIMEQEDGSVRVIDFGLVKRRGSDVYSVMHSSSGGMILGSHSSESFESLHFAKSGDVPPPFETRQKTKGAVGTMYYMPPEQLYGGATTEKSDTWPVLLMIIEALHGEVAFEGWERNKIIQVLLDHPQEQKPNALEAIKNKFSKIAGPFPESRLLDSLLKKGFCRNPEKRPPMDELSVLINIYIILRAKTDRERGKLLEQYLEKRQHQLRSLPNKLELVLKDSQREAKIHSAYIRNSIALAEVAMSEGDIGFLVQLGRNIDRMLQMTFARPPYQSVREKPGSSPQRRPSLAS